MSKAIDGPGGGAELRARTPTAVVGAVIIGRNEGLRLQRCFDTLPQGLRRVVYVDSGSTDDSVAQARRRGVEVVALDMSIPFTAARARNEGFRLLRALVPDLDFVQFVDGDCELLPGWIDAAAAALHREPSIALVTGRLHERNRDASVYNRLCDMEWDGPIGDLELCGGICMMRVGPLVASGGFNEILMAGEEPELCVRLRRAGHRIVRIAVDMALHDAAMTQARQWWKRAMRDGYSTAELAGMHPEVWRTKSLRMVAWGLGLPMTAAVSAPPTGGLGLTVLGAYPALWLRIVLRRQSEGRPLGEAALYATHIVAGKVPQALGVLKYHWGQLRGRRWTVGEYRQ
ncbi:MAG: glycosyltransferase [Deltaproteobacteria bacterium]|nr:glycosyltransferase [Deltaproteobacteria bacterium]